MIACTRVPFPSEKAALVRLMQITAQCMSGNRRSPLGWGRNPVAVYRCRCGSFHLTSHPRSNRIAAE